MTDFVDQILYRALLCSCFAYMHCQLVEYRFKPQANFASERLVHNIVSPARSYLECARLSTLTGSFGFEYSRVSGTCVIRQYATGDDVCDVIYSTAVHEYGDTFMLVGYDAPGSNHIVIQLSCQHHPDVLMFLSSI